MHGRTDQRWVDRVSPIGILVRRCGPRRRGRRRVGAERVLLWAIVLLTADFSAAQDKNGVGVIDHFSGQVTVTNNGISLIPSFSLGEPAALFNLSMGRGRFSFDPELRFALEGKPWSFIFWGSDTGC